MATGNKELVELLCEEFPFTRTEARLLVNSAPERYKVHFIEKRNGRGRRLIAQPTAELKAVQRWLVQKYVEKMPIHHAAKAYRKEIGIKDHAIAHASKKYLLKVDFKDFFPSILASDFETHLHKYFDISYELAADISRLLFRLDEKGTLSLSIGAPSSPTVSNTIMFEFDSRIDEFCTARDVVYTRYADDLAFSTNIPHLLDEVFKEIQSLLKAIAYPRLVINPDKTVYTSKKFQRQLTGLILTNDGAVSLGRERKRMIRAMAHKYSEGTLDPGLIGRLKGFLAFAHSIDPAFVDKTRRDMGEEKYQLLLKYE